VKASGSATITPTGNVSFFICGPIATGTCDGTTNVGTAIGTRTIQSTDPDSPKYMPLPKCGSASSEAYEVEGVSNGPHRVSSRMADMMGLNCRQAVSASPGRRMRKRCIITWQW